MIRFSLIIAIFACINVEGQQQRNAPPTGPGSCLTVTGRTCQFPFVYRGKSYHACTYDHTENGRPWCAYETRSDGNAVPNRTEDCDTSVCSIGAEECRTVSGPYTGYPCKFPFTLSDGTTHYTCAFGYNGERWCSTNTDIYGYHISGSWGNCGYGCNLKPWAPSPAPVPVPAPAPETHRVYFCQFVFYGCVFRNWGNCGYGCNL